MSIQNIQSSTQNSELYQIRKQTESQQAEQVQAQQNVQEISTQNDEYDKAVTVGEEPEGIYSVSYDEDGTLKVNYTQPAAKSDVKASGGAVQSAESSEDSSEDIEKEIEQLKKQRDQIKQQLNKEKDEEVKKSLRVQLQAIEAQIAQKTAQLQA